MPILGLFIFLCTDWLSHWLPVYIGWLITRICPIPEQQPGPGVHAKQLQRVHLLPEPPWVTGDTLLLWLQAPGLFRGLPRLILSHFGPSGVHLWTHLRCHQPGRTTNPEHWTEQNIRDFLFLLLLSNKYFGTSYCFGLPITPLLSIEKAIEQLATTADGPAVYYNYDEATVGLFFIYFEEISVESPIA